MDKNLIKTHLQKIDLMIEMLESEEKEIRKRESDIICDLEGLYRKKDELLTLLSGSEFSASLLDEDWDIHGTLSLRSKLLDKANEDAKKQVRVSREEMINDWKKKSKKSKESKESRKSRRRREEEKDKRPSTPRRSDVRFRK